MNSEELRDFLKRNITPALTKKILDVPPEGKLVWMQRGAEMVVVLVTQANKNGCICQGNQ